MKKHTIQSLNEALNEAPKFSIDISKERQRGMKAGDKLFGILKPQLNGYQDKEQAINFAAATVIRLLLNLEKELPEGAWKNFRMGGY